MKNAMFIFVCAVILLSCEEPASSNTPSIDLTKSTPGAGFVVPDSTYGRSIRVIFFQERMSRDNREKLAEFINSGKNNIIKVDMKTSNSGWVYWVAVYYTEK